MAQDEKNRMTLPNLKNVFFNKTAAITMSSMLAVCAALAYRSYKIVDAAHFGVHIKMGKMISDNLPPGIHFKYPLFDNIYPLRNNTIILETPEGRVNTSTNYIGSGRNTHEQNMMNAEMRLHYQIDRNRGVIALHADTMMDDNGKNLLMELMDQSFNAVVGERHSTEHLADTNGLLRAFSDNLEWRIGQNNVPVRIDAIELLVLRIGDGNNPYRVPIQMRIRRNDADGKQGWTIEKMAGPAAIPVQGAKGMIAPSPGGS